LQLSEKAGTKRGLRCLRSVVPGREPVEDSGVGKDWFGPSRAGGPESRRDVRSTLVFECLHRVLGRGDGVIGIHIVGFPDLVLGLLRKRLGWRLHPGSLGEVFLREQGTRCDAKAGSALRKVRGRGSGGPSGARAGESRGGQGNGYRHCHPRYCYDYVRS
jgi:hypothetical protein